MESQEAIMRVKEFGLHHAINDLPNSAKTVEAFETVISATEKQDAKKPILTTIFEGEKAEKLKGMGLENYPSYKCPICDYSVADRTCVTKIHPDGWRKQKYCDNCGQKLDWE